MPINPSLFRAPTHAEVSRPATPYPQSGNRAEWESWINDPGNQEHLDWLNSTDAIEAGDLGSLVDQLTNYAANNPDGGLQDGSGLAHGTAVTEAAPGYDASLTEYPNPLQDMMDLYEESRPTDAYADIAQGGRELAGNIYSHLDDFEATARGDAYDKLGGYADELYGIYEQGGLTDVTRAQLEANRRNAMQMMRGSREAALQDLAERGMAGGGAEVLAGIGDRAAASSWMNAADLDAAAFAQEQALQQLLESRGIQSELQGIDHNVANTMLEGRTAADTLVYDTGTLAQQDAINVFNTQYVPFHRNLIEHGFMTSREGSMPASRAAGESLTYLGDENIGAAGAGTLLGLQGLPQYTSGGMYRPPTYTQPGYIAPPDPGQVLDATPGLGPTPPSQPAPAKDDEEESNG